MDSQLSKLTRAEKKYNHTQSFHILILLEFEMGKINLLVSSLLIRDTNINELY